MKTLNEQVNEIMNAKSSKQTKSISLIKLGLTPYEVKVMLGSISVPATCKFNANNLTFGVEIECYNVIRQTLIQEVEQRNISIKSEGYNHTDNSSYYKMVSYASIVGENGQEVVSPILKGKKGLDSLKMVCQSLDAVGAKVNRSTGLHVHFDASGISDEHFIRIFINYRRLEDVIDTFMPHSRRENNNQFCKSLHGIPYASCHTKSDVISANGTRYRKVNAESYLRHKTIEFRQHSGTIEYTKISNWINFLRKLIQYSYESEISYCERIEDIPFLNEREKAYFISRREQLSNI